MPRRCRRIAVPVAPEVVARDLAPRFGEEADQITLADDVAVHGGQQGFAVGAAWQVEWRVEREQLEMVMMRT